MVRNRIPACIACQYMRAIRHQGGLPGFADPDHLKKPIVRITLDVKLRRQPWVEVHHILKGDVAFVWSGMYRDALCPKNFKIKGRL
jgi:hypothetical protein